MPTPSLNEYLIISGLLFAIGLGGVIIRRNIIVIFMCLELMLAAASLTLVAFSRFNVTDKGLPDYDGQMLVFFIITVAAAEVAVGFAIIVSLYRARQSIHTDELTSLKGLTHHASRYRLKTYIDFPYESLVTPHHSHRQCCYHSAGAQAQCHRICAALHAVSGIHLHHRLSLIR